MGPALTWPTDPRAAGPPSSGPSSTRDLNES
jgi:hypothetical protein